MNFNNFLLEELSAPVKNAIVGGPFGSNLVSKDYSPNGVPVIRGQNMGGRWVAGDFVFVSEEKAKALSSNIARPGDLIFTQRGTLGQVSIVPKDRYPEYVVSQSQMKITLDASKADVEYLYYVFKTQEQLAYIQNTAIQTGVPHTNLGILKRTPVKLPALSVQREVAKTLGVLDDKIALLRETNETLESIAQTLFKSWFVDFDAVKAKMEGRTPEGMDDATVALFPSGLDESELGHIPRGWQVLQLGDVIETVGGGTPDTKNLTYWYPPLHHWTTPKDLSENASPVLLSTERKLSDAGLAKISSGLLPAGSLILSSRAPIGYLALIEIPLAINQGYIAMLPGGVLPPLYMFFWCKQNMSTIKSRANGSTFMEISKRAFRPIPVLVPKPEAVNAFVEIARDLFEKISNGEKQIRFLHSIRDAILPRLMSGQISMSGTPDE